MQNRLRLGLVGTGPVTNRYHLPAIRAVPEVVPTMAVDADPTRAQEFTRRQGFPRWSSRVEDLFGNVDLAIVAVPNGAHASASCMLLEQGIHVLCEKPMARNIAECREMIAAAERGRAQLCIGHNRRFRHNVQLLKKLLDKGAIGEVLQVSAEEGSAHDWVRSAAYFDRAQAGGGSLMDVGIHSIDLIRWLVGEFRAVEYKGDERENTVESEAELRFTLAQGAAGTLLASRTRDLQQRILFTGSEGYLDLGLWSEDLRIHSRRGKAFQQLPFLNAFVSRRPQADPSFVFQLNNLVAAIRQESPLLVDGYQAMASVDVVCRAYGEIPRVGPAAEERRKDSGQYVQ